MSFGAFLIHIDDLSDVYLILVLDINCLLLIMPNIHEYKMEFWDFRTMLLEREI